MLCIINNSIKHYSFVYTQSNGQTVLFLTICFNIIHMLAHSLNVKQFYLTNRLDPIRCYHSRSEWTLEQCHWRGTLHFPKLKHWSLTIWCHWCCRDAVGVFYRLSWLGWNIFVYSCQYFLYVFHVCIKCSDSGGARGVMVIVLGNGHGDTSSNSGPDWLHFT